MRYTNSRILYFTLLSLDKLLVFWLTTLKRRRITDDPIFFWKRKCWQWDLLPVSWLQSTCAKPRSEVIQETLETWPQEGFLLPESCYQLEFIAATRLRSIIGLLLQEAAGWSLPRCWCFHGLLLSTSTCTRARSNGVLGSKGLLNDHS